MQFCGMSKVFSTAGDGQYETIGAFWDAMSQVFGRENLRGLGYSWTESSITYVIGLKNESMPQDIRYPGANYQEIQLPDDGWLHYTGRTEQLPQLYAEIYGEGMLKYEIEQFYENGSCEIFVIRA